MNNVNGQKQSKQSKTVKERRLMQQTRLDRILQLIEERGTVTNAELVELLNASESTVRRDIALLDKANRIQRVHGGATSLGRFYKEDQELSVRKEHRKEDKQIIARYAASLVKPGDIVFIDAGSTTAMLAEYISEHTAKYFTNAWEIARTLTGKGFEVYIIGGRYKGITEANAGVIAVSQIQAFNYTVAFIGGNGIKASQGFSTTELEEAGVKRAAVGQTEKSYILMDPEKLKEPSNIVFAKPDEAVLITTVWPKESDMGDLKVIEAGKSNI
jgi:DeoR family fructose operon transcriptional repressor